MNSDLQAIMARRRRLAESGTEENPPSAQPPPESHASSLESSMGSLDLQNATAAHGSSSDLLANKQQQQNAHYIHHHASMSKLEMNSDLQAIMQRRRRLADSGEISQEDIITNNNNNNNHSHHLEGSTDSFGVTAAANASSGSLVKENMKSFEMSKDLQAIMERRRRLADGGATDSGAGATEAPAQRGVGRSASLNHHRATPEVTAPSLPPMVPAAGPRSVSVTSAAPRVTATHSDPVESPQLRRMSEQATRQAPPGQLQAPSLTDDHEEEQVVEMLDEEGGEEEAKVTTTKKSRPRGHHEEEEEEEEEDDDNNYEQQRSQKNSSKRRQPNSQHSIEATSDESAPSQEDDPVGEKSRRRTTKKKSDDEAARSSERDRRGQRTGRKSSAAPSSSAQPERSGDARKGESQAGADNSSSHDSSPVARSSQNKKMMRRNSSGADFDEKSVDDTVPSMDSKGSSGRSAPRSGANHKPSRRSSTGVSLDHLSNETTSLEILSKERSTSHGSSDDVSKADVSVNSKARRSRRSSNHREEVSRSRASRRSSDTVLAHSTVEIEQAPPAQQPRIQSRRSSDGGFAGDDTGGPKRRTFANSRDKSARSLRHSESEATSEGITTESGHQRGLRSMDSFDSDDGGALTMTNPDPASSGWDFPSFPATTSGASGFGGDAFAGFSTDFQDAKFDDATSGFGSFGVAAFPAMETKPTAIASSTSAFDTTFDMTSGFDAFESTPEFTSQPKIEQHWDKEPIKDPPKRPQAKLQLGLKPLFARQFHGPPVSNPANGNIIFCSSSENGDFLHEIDPKRACVQVLAVPVVSFDLQRKVASKYNLSVHSVYSVLALASGLHQAHGQLRVRVAAIMDLLVLESNQIMRIVALWQWGYATPEPVLLQTAMTPPSGGDFTFDAATLNLADGLLFIAGASPKGPCIFMCKPALRETWSANFLAGSGRVTALSLAANAGRPFPYLAVALNDKTISIWTYQPALAGTTQKGSEASKKWLFPLCRLEHLSILASVEASPPSPDETSATRDFKDVGQCTHLAWQPIQATPSLLLLAVAFQNGIALFHVGLPVLADSSTGGYRALPEPSQNSVLSQAPPLSPFVAKRWLGKHELSLVSWANLGPHVNPCLTILLHSSESGGNANILLATVNYPLYRKAPVAKDSLVPCRVVANSILPRVGDSFPTGLLRNSGLQSLYCHSNSRLLQVILSTSSPVTAIDPAMASLAHPIASCAHGVSSLGEVLHVDTSGDKDGVLHVFSLTQCERRKSPLDDKHFEWSLPMRRHWLCRTVPGDTKETFTEEVKEDRGFGGSDEVAGGAAADSICELYHDSLSGLAPFRIVRSKFSNICAVLFRSGFCAKGESFDSASLDAISVAIVAFSGHECGIDVVKGRDIAFLPTNGASSICGLILGRDGTSLCYFTWNENSNTCKLGNPLRPILGVDADKDFVECRKIFAFEGHSMVRLLCVGTRLYDGRTCIVAGELCDAASLNSDKWEALLPNIATHSCAFLEDGEELFSLVGLQDDETGYRNFAASTSSRILLLSSALTVEAEVRDVANCSGLSPIGSFAVAYCSNSKMKYLCCLEGRFNSGAIASLPLSPCGSGLSLLVAIRPDRAILAESHSGIRLVETGQNPDTFLLPPASTRPLLLLEPLVANAVCHGGKQSQSTAILRTVIERFGRTVASIAHGEHEGIGHSGAGITQRVFQVLEAYGLQGAASWLLTGVVPFSRSANTKILPTWLPIIPKAAGAPSADSFLHVIANGDQYLSDYVKSPDQNMPSALPRQSDPCSYLSQEYAMESLSKGKLTDAAKTLDLTGSMSADGFILQMGLLMERKQPRDALLTLKSMSGYDDNGLTSAFPILKASSSLAALATHLKSSRGQAEALEMKAQHIQKYMKTLAPSLQRGLRGSRARQRLLGEQALASMVGDLDQPNDPMWLTSCNEAKHVWNEGPKRQKENLLVLDRIEDWLGRRRPLILGREGATAARDRGEKTLADLMNQDDDDSFGGKSDLESEKDGWIDGVGEGRSDEANLSGYFRMSEGEDEDSPWRSEGLLDLSPYQNKAVIVGDRETFSLQPSTTSVDEGEPGKVKSLYDFVCEKAGTGIASGLALPASRGGSIDIGVLHGADRSARSKCSIEFWFYLPRQDQISDEIVLIRRTMGQAADDFSKVALASDKESVLWEVTVRRSGELEFRTCGGSFFLSSQKFDKKATSPGEKKERNDLVSFEKWNHLCIILVSRGPGVADCHVSMYLKGTEVASSATSMMPPGYDEDDLESTSTLDEIMQKSHLLFALNHAVGLRITEIRFWACERSSDDIERFLFEYLTAAEAKKKFKVKITNKNKRGAAAALGKGTFLTPPTSGGLAPARGMVATTKSGFLAPSRFSPDDKAAKKQSEGVSLAPRPAQPGSKEPALAAVPESQPAKVDTSVGFNTSFDGFGSDGATAMGPDGFPVASQEAATHPEEGEMDEEEPATLWDTALPLSQQVRSSAAAALIRGPPATRHFGGNRGGLPDFSGMDRFGVGGIAISGSEKTIVFRDNEDPPALTYPIGASGAIVSDQMDDEGSEFLCCFLAKERRMVVFELQSRTVVVELQMTTKLNFWRFLPPEAAENTLCFMLVTPVGGFHWMPLEESPRPRQVWKRGPDLQGKKVVSYEEGGSNGLDGYEIRSRVGLVMVTRSTGGGFLEAWIVPIAGDSQAVQISDDVLGACFCQPTVSADGPFLPLLVTAHIVQGELYVNVLSVEEPSRGSLRLGGVEITQVIDLSTLEDDDLDPPAMAMGTYPEAICCSLSNIVVVIIRRKGLIAAFELEDEDMSLIAQESVGHFVIDAFMRYSAEVGGAEIVMLLSDQDNPKDGRMVSFCFRSAA